MLPFESGTNELMERNTGIRYHYIKKDKKKKGRRESAFPGMII